MSMFVNVDLTTVHCGTCGVVHAIPQIKHKTAKDEGGFWFCPNGHERGYRTGAHEDDLKECQQKLKQRMEEETDQLTTIARLRSNSRKDYDKLETFIKQIKRLKEKNRKLRQ